MAATLKRLQDELKNKIFERDNPGWLGNIWDDTALKQDISRLQNLIADLSGGQRAPFTTGGTGTPTSEKIETPVKGPAALGDFVKPRRGGPSTTVKRTDLRERGRTFKNVSLVQQAYAGYMAELGKYNTTFARGGISVPQVSLEQREEILTAIGDRGLGGTLPRDA